MSRTRFFEKIEFEEEGDSVRRFCWCCHGKHTILVKVAHIVSGYGMSYNVKTKNRIGICTNKDCWRYTEPNSIPTWVREDTSLPNEVPKGKLVLDPQDGVKMLK